MLLNGRVLPIGGVVKGLRLKLAQQACLSIDLLRIKLVRECGSVGV